MRPTAARIASACRKSKRAYDVRPARGEKCVSVRDTSLILGHDRSLRQRGSVFVAFRGSATPRDWITNMCLWLVPSALSPEARVHSGFSRLWESVRPRVFEELEAMRPTRILLTGHSLGGACATVASSDIVARFPDATVDVITFGAPRCGNARFIECVSHAVDVFARVVHEGDLVPWMLCPRYDHDAREWAYLRPGGALEWRQPVVGCWVGLCAMWARASPLGVRHHFIEQYVSAFSYKADGGGPSA
jgi:hypothetical protein